jgi:tetratricopeptide (TPR) repeat protein
MSTPDPDAREARTPNASAAARSAAFRRRCSARTLATFTAAAAVALGCSSEPTPEEITALQDAGRFAQTLEPLRRTVEAGNASTETIFRYGMALSRTGSVSQALWPLQQAAEDPEYFARATLELARGAYKTGNFEFVDEQLTTLIEREPEHVDALRLRSQARLRSRRNYEGALEDIERVAEINPDERYTQMSRVVALLGLDRIDDAGDALLAMADEHPDDEDEASQEYRVLACAAGAKFAEEKGEIESASKRYTACLETHPGASLVIQEAIEFYGKQGEHDRIDEILVSGNEAAPEDRSIRIALARRRQVQGDLEGAEEVLRGATEALYPGAWLDLAGFLADSGQIDAALETYENGRKLGASTPAFMLGYAEALLSAERHDEALAIADEMGVESHAELIRGKAALARGNNAMALEHFSAGTLLWPDNAIARYYTARAAENLGRFDRAIEEYRYAIRVDANATDARQRIARIHLAQNEPAAALYMLTYQNMRSPVLETDDSLLLLELEAYGQGGREGAGLDPRVVKRIQDPSTWGVAVAAIARGAQRRGGPVAAVQSIENADRLSLEDPTAAPALRSLVRNLAELERAAEGLAAAQRASARNPEHVGLLEILGEAQLLAGETDAAVTTLERAVEAQPRRRGAWGLLARAHAVGGRTDAARDSLTRAAEIPTEDVQLLRAEAAVARTLGQDERARAMLARALSIRPTDGDAALALAELRLAQGEQREAVAPLLARATRFGLGERARQLGAGTGTGSS